MKLSLIHIALLAVACALTFSNTFHNAYHLDDVYRVWNNVGAQEFWPPWRHFVDPGTSAMNPRLVQYRPLLPLSLSLNVAICGVNLVCYHVGNLLLHLFAGVGVYLLVRELLGHWQDRVPSVHAPLFVALLFALHPVGGIAVNYIGARDLSMMLGFLTLALWQYARMARLGATRTRWISCLALLLLAMLAKKNAVVAPALIFLFELLPGRRSVGDRIVWQRVGWFAVLPVALLLFVRFRLGFSDFDNVVASSDPTRYLAGQIQFHVFHYLRNFVWPFPMRFAPDDVPVRSRELLGAVILVGSWVLAWRWRRTRPLLVFCILAYQVLLAPTSSLVPFHAPIVPYRPYASSVFLFLGVALLVRRRERLGLVALGALAIYFGTVSFILNRTWRTGETFWQHSVDHGGTAFAYTSLGESLGDGKRAEAAFREALRIQPGHAMAQVGLAMLEIRRGRRELGLQRLRRGVEVQPNSASIRSFYAEGLAAAGRLPEAARQAGITSDLEPENLDYRCHAGEVAVRAGQFAMALRRLAPLLRDRPGYKTTRWSAGVALLNLHRLPESIRMLKRYVADYPDQDSAWFNLGTAYGIAGHTAQAIAALEECVRLNPGFRKAHSILANLYGDAGDHAAAKRHRGLSRGR